MLLSPRDIFDWWNNISDTKSDRGSTCDYENSKFITKMVEVNTIFSITFFKSLSKKDFNVSIKKYKWLFWQQV